MIRIRPANSQDISALARLAKEQVEHQAQLDSGLQPVPDADWKAYISTRLRRPNAAIFVAERDGVIIGYSDIRIAQQGAPPNRSSLKALLRRLINRARKTQPSVLAYRRYGLFEDIYVSQSSRLTGAGIGLRLFKASIEWFREKQIQEIEGFVDVSNAPTQEIVRKLGFEPVKTWLRMRL